MNSDDKGKRAKETLADEVKALAGKIYDDAAAPAAKAAGGTLGRVVRLALRPLELIVQGEEVAELREMFENLLVTSMDRNTAAGAHPAFVTMISQLTPDEAWILKSIDRSDYALYTLREYADTSKSLGFRTALGLGAGIELGDHQVRDHRDRDRHRGELGTPAPPAPPPRARRGRAARPPAPRRAFSSADLFPTVAAAQNAVRDMPVLGA